MLRRVLARSPLPSSATVTASSKVSAAKAKLLKERGIHVSFATPTQAREDLHGIVPIGYTAKAGEVEWSQACHPNTTARAEATKASSDSRPLPALVAGVGVAVPTVRDYRLAVTAAVRKAKTCQAAGLTIQLPKHDVTSVADPFHPSEVLSRDEVVEKTASFAVAADYHYNRLKTTATTPQQTPAAPQKTNRAPKQRRGGRKLSAASASSSSSPLDIVINTQRVAAVRVGEVIGHCMNDARNLGNLREDEGIPELYVAWARRYMLPEGIRIRKILRGQQLADAGLQLLYNVGKGSRHEPYMMVLEYVGNRRSASSTALVGKGVTFDCGGLNVKPYPSMETMHTDMMGAAVSLATLKAVATLKLPINVVAAVGLVENAIGPDSYHPSSILTSLKGLTVEVLNTDAEGRLVLADVLTYVQRDAPLEKTPNKIIDLATLTGAIIVSLGSRRAGVFSPNGDLMQTLMRCGAQSGEEVWPMPIGEEHKTAMKGGIADLINCAPGRQGGSCTAAAFLSNFIEPGVQWAHLDIAGTSDSGDRPKGYEPAGVTGFGVQLLMDYLRRTKKA